MKLLFWIILINTLLSIVLSGMCQKKQQQEIKQDSFILAVIENGNLLCNILQFLMLSDYELFFKKYKKNCV